MQAGALRRSCLHTIRYCTVFLDALLLRHLVEVNKQGLQQAGAHKQVLLHFNRACCMLISHWRCHLGAVKSCASRAAWLRGRLVQKH